MTGWLRTRLGRVALQIAALHALVAGSSPLFHHDFVCHLKSPTHCEACVQTPMGSRAEAKVTLERPRFEDVGHILAAPASHQGNGPSRGQGGRAPPA